LDNGVDHRHSVDHDVTVTPGSGGGPETPAGFRSAELRSFPGLSLDCEIYEAAPQLRPIGVGINVLPHATKILARLGVEARLAAVGVATRESAFNRFGQLIYTESAGRLAGYEHPQFSIHRGDLQGVLLSAVTDRLGPGRLSLGHTCTGVSQDEDGATLTFRSTAADVPLRPARADVVVACDGIHSRLRKQLHPDEGPPVYSGVNMWRGTVIHPPFLTGASMTRAGWLTTGKLRRGSGDPRRARPAQCPGQHRDRPARVRGRPPACDGPGGAHQPGDSARRHLAGSVAPDR